MMNKINAEVTQHNSQTRRSFLTGRQKPLDYDVTDDTIENWVKLMLSYLDGEDWLKTHKKHPISQLWERKDAMSTNELVTFARAIYIMDAVDKNWLTQTMRLVTSNDINNAHGAIFEIMALSTFKEANFIVSPAPMGCPGIDGTARTQDNGIDINLSLKYYGVSRAEQNFLEFMDELDKLIKASLCFSSADVRLNLKRYPETNSDKKLLREIIKSAVNKYNKIAVKSPYDSRKVPNVPDDFAEVFICPIEGFRLSRVMNSHKFIAVSPMHKNEHKNLSDKIDDACRNLVKARIAATSSAGSINGIIIHLHENADIVSYQEQAQRYLDEHPSAPIGFIILYQACIAFYSDDRHGILHCIQSAVSQNTAALMSKCAHLKDRIIPVFRFFVGNLTFEPPKRMLVNNTAGRTMQAIELRDVYFYQKGEIYEDAYKDTNGKLNGDIRMIAPGVRVSAVFPFQDKLGQNKYIIADAPMPVSDHLEIL